MWRPVSASRTSALRAFGLASAAALLTAQSACSRAGATSDANIDALPRLTAEAGMRIGDGSDPDVGFSRVAGVDVDRDGNIYVVEALVPEIRVYDRQGAFVRRFGRRGGGPGEFESTPQFGVSGDTVWAIDNAGFARITLFDRQGNVLSTGRTEGVKIPLPASTGFLRPWFMRPDGRFTSHFARIAFSRNDPPSGVKETDSIPVPHVLFDATGAVVDTVGWADRPPPRMWSPPSERSGSEYRTVEAGGRRRIVPSPPLASPHWEPLRDGYLLVETPLARSAEQGTMTVTRMGLAGDTVYHRTLRYRPTRYAAEELDSIAARAARGEPGGMAPYRPPGPDGPAVPDNWQGIAATLRDAMNFPEFRLPVRSTWVAQDESIWLRRTTEEGAPSRWILLDPEGRPRGELELPSNVRVVWSRGDVFWGVVPDENDVPWLVRYAVRGG